MSIDVSPTKEIKGLTLRSLAQFIIAIATGVFMYVNLITAIHTLTDKLDRQDKAQEQDKIYYEFKIRSLENNIRDNSNNINEIRIRLTRLETELKIK